MSLAKAASFSAALFILVNVGPFPAPLRGLVTIALLLIWLNIGIRWTIRCYGAKAIVVHLILGLTFAGAAGYAYWQDTPNRQLVAQLNELGAYYVGTNGKLLTGDVDYVYFDSNATDEQVRKFTDLPGLEHLQRLVIKGTRITDETAKRFSRFSQLWLLHIEGPYLSEETIDWLSDRLPDCHIEIVD